MWWGSGRKVWCCSWLYKDQKLLVQECMSDTNLKTLKWCVVLPIIITRRNSYVYSTDLCCIILQFIPSAGGRLLNLIWLCLCCEFFYIIKWYSWSVRQLLWLRTCLSATCALLLTERCEGSSSWVHSIFNSAFESTGPDTANKSVKLLWCWMNFFLL